VVFEGQADLRAIATLSLFEESIGALYDAGTIPSRFTSQISINEGSGSATTNLNRPRFVRIPGPHGVPVLRLLVAGECNIVSSGPPLQVGGVPVPTKVTFEALIRLSIVLTQGLRLHLEDVQLSTSVGGRLLEVMSKAFRAQLVPDVRTLINPALDTLQADLTTPLVEALKSSCAHAGLSPGPSGWQTSIRPLPAADGTVEAVAVELGRGALDLGGPPTVLEVERAGDGTPASSTEIPAGGKLMQPIRRIRDLFQSSRRPDE
jgi:hypothetical protein